MSHSRRSFFGLAGASAGLAFSPSAAASIRQLGGLLAAVPPAKEEFWNLVVSQFPLRSGKIPMNAANLCPSPRVVSDRVAELTRDEDSDVSPANRVKFATMLTESRKKVAAQLGVTPDEIALVRNTSEANNVINNGIELGKGDEVVLWEQNHPSNNAAWDVRAARRGFTVKRVAVPAAVKSAAEIVKLFDAALTPRTKVLSITHISNTSGMRMPAKELCALARSRGIHAHVDGAQSWGYLQLNLKDLGCDSFSSSAHKWFMGPKEVGLLYVRKESMSHVWPGVVSAGWHDEALTGTSAPAKFEPLGQRDDAALAALGTAADFHAMVGPAQVEARTTALASALKDGFKKVNKVKVVTPMDPALSGGVVIVAVPGLDREKTAALVSALYEKYGIAGAPTGGVRLSPHTYNTMADMELAVRGVKELLG